MKYWKEKNFQLTKQEKALLEKSARLNGAIEALQRDINDIKANLNNATRSVDATKNKLQSLEQEKMLYLKGWFLCVD